MASPVSKPKLLIVERDPALRQWVRGMMEDSFEVFETDNHRAAVAIVSERRDIAIVLAGVPHTPTAAQEVNPDVLAQNLPPAHRIPVAHYEIPPEVEGPDQISPETLAAMLEFKIRMIAAVANGPNRVFQGLSGRSGIAARG